jgi:hypothetical protein
MESSQIPPLDNKANIVGEQEKVLSPASGLLLQ